MTVTIQSTTVTPLIPAVNLDKQARKCYGYVVRTFTMFTLPVIFYLMDSAIESVRKRYQITVAYKHISEAEAAMKTEAIVGAVARLLRPQSPVQPVDGEGA